MTILELEEYFKTSNLPEKVDLTPGVTVVDVPVFIQSHLEVLRNYPNVQVFLPFHERLIQLKHIVENK